MRRSQHGLTLIEVMVALVFTGIAFTALALSQVTGFKVTRSSQQTVIAKDVGMRQLELFRGYGFHPFVRCPTIDPEVYNPDSYTGYPACEATQASADHPGFTLDWSLTNNPAGTKLMSPDPALVEVKIDVFWQSGDETKHFYLTSYLSCGDPGEFATTNVPCPKETLLGP